VRLLFIMSDLLRLAGVISAFCLILLQQLPVRAEPQRKPDAGMGAEAPKIVPRPSADAICRTLVQAATDNNLPIEFFTRLCPSKVRTSVPVAAFHNLTILSSLPDTIRRPSGENAADSTMC
jgi:hypothetical protein